MLMSFDIKFIRRDQKQRGIGEACRAVVEIPCQCILILGLSGEIRNSGGMARLVEALTRLSIYHALLADVMAKR